MSMNDTLKGRDHKFWIGLKITSLVGIGVSLLFNVWTVEIIFSSDGRIEWPHTLHIWLIQIVTMVVSVVGFAGYVKRNRIRILVGAMSVSRQANVLIACLICIEVFLALAFLLTYEHPGFSDWGYLYYLFHLDIEFNIPSLFSVGQFWLAAWIAYLCYRVSGRGGAFQDAFAWLAAAIVMALLGFDELLSFHEDAEVLLVATGIVGEGFDHRMGGYGWSWTLVALPLALVFGMWFACRFYSVFNDRRYHFLLLIIAGGVFLTGSIFIENLQVYVRDQYQLTRSPKIMLLAEEMLEMFGVSLAIYVFFSHLSEKSIFARKLVKR